MEILDKKSNRMSRANTGVFECNEFPDLQRILDFLSLRNLLSNELFFTFYEFSTAPFFIIKMEIHLCPLLFSQFQHSSLYSILLYFLFQLPPFFCTYMFLDLYKHNY